MNPLTFSSSVTNMPYAAYSMSAPSAPTPSLLSAERPGVGESNQPAANTGSPELREAFNDFVGQTFYGLMLKSMRSTVGEPAYFHGGRMEEVFQGQLDQVLAEHLSDASASTFTDPMYELFMLPPPR